MTREAKIDQIRKFIQRLESIVATADVDDDCKQTLPRFHRCEENLISFLREAGFTNDANIIAGNATFVPETYGAPLITTIQEDVGFYTGKLNALLEDLLDPVYVAQPSSSGAHEMRADSTVDVFVSHSSRDEQLASALIKVLETAFPNIVIRCSSVPGHRFEVGGDYRAQLRAEVDDSTVFLALLTPASLRSSEVLFEIGARWGTHKTPLPLLAAGATPVMLSGLLKALQGVDIEKYDDLKTVMSQIAKELKKTFSATSAFNGAFGVLRTESKRRSNAYFPRLQVRGATWGSGTTQAYVTAQVKENVHNNKLVMQASMVSLGDPIFGKPKRLIINYSYDGEEKDVTVPEHDWVTLPSD